PTMINLLIIAHETLGTAYTALARHILPLSDFSHIHQLHVQPDDDHAAIIQRAQDRLARTAPNHGTLILTDIFGATPCNAALKLVIPRQTSMVTGLNAPMLVKALTHCAHSTDLARFTETVQQAGINGILAFTEPPDGGA
ncbi:MAG: PTS sugar transporter subunit IIA, partial [Kingella oralis]